MLLGMSLSARAGAEEKPHAAKADVQYSAGLHQTSGDFAGNDLIFNNRSIMFRYLIIGLESKQSAFVRTRLAYDAAANTRRASCETNPEIANYRRKVQRCSGDGLQEAFVSVHITGDLSLKIGKERVNQGGWIGTMTSSQGFSSTPYIKYHQPFERLQTMFELSWYGFSLQLTDDVTTSSESTGVFTRKNYQPAPVVQYVGQSNILRPRIQGAFYDLNKSYVIAAGLKLSMSKLEVTIDAIEDHRRQKFLFTNDRADPRKIFRQQSATADISLTDGFKTFLQFSRMDVDQPTIPTVGLNSVAYNQSGFDDNFQGWGGGITIDGLLPASSISLGWHQAAGRFLKADSVTGEKRVWNTWSAVISGRAL